MKKILLGTLAIGMVAITGCQKVDENDINKRNGSCEEFEFKWSDVTNDSTGRTWMDRNLGASRVATSSTDVEGYGDFYQWGRGTDGHECKYSDTIYCDTVISLSQGDNPGHGNFIVIAEGINDWIETKNDSLWQGVDGINNPCPTGYRLPTKTEWEEEVESWTSEDHNGAFGSVLKLPMAGYRYDRDGLLYTSGAFGYYWSSTVSGKNARYLYFGNSSANVNTDRRAGGFNVRCIKD